MDADDRGVAARGVAGNVPTRILVGRDDRLFPADFQQGVARERLGIEANEIRGGHLLALSEPGSSWSSGSRPIEPARCG